MIREDRWVNKTCSHCRRPDWNYKVRFVLYTEEEQLKYSDEICKVEGAPEGAELCDAGLGGTITEAIREGIEIATLMNKVVAFTFNGPMVLVEKNSDVIDLYTKWSLDLYCKTPQQIFDER